MSDLATLLARPMFDPKTSVLVESSYGQASLDLASSPRRLAAGFPVALGVQVMIL